MEYVKDIPKATVIAILKQLEDNEVSLTASNILKQNLEGLYTDYTRVKTLVEELQKVLTTTSDVLTKTTDETIPSIDTIASIDRFTIKHTDNPNINITRRNIGVKHIEIRSSSVK